eukprot:TRINITY_DN2676_c1_g1_i3.p1 TRINITY_DN2676_c1_g1~~TRINITY_DN2676_c1_g1_i3.p1  ORF type:complete len:862 (-),score=129.21 TRINITY_DN2676_c1_g1_i3:2072-4657(-)
MSSCTACGQPMSSGWVEAMGMHFHQQCFVCQVCKEPMGLDEFNTIEGAPAHPTCFETVRPKDYCTGCAEAFKLGDKQIIVSGGRFHTTCFKCNLCWKEFAEREVFAVVASKSVHTGECARKAREAEAAKNRPPSPPPPPPPPPRPPTPPPTPIEEPKPCPKCPGLEQQVADLQAKLAEAERQATQAQKELQDHLSTCKEQVQSLKEKAQSLENALDTVKGENKLLEQKTTEQSAALQTAKAEAELQKREAQRNEAQVMALEDKLKAAEAALDTTKTSSASKGEMGSKLHELEEALNVANVKADEAKLEGVARTARVAEQLGETERELQRARETAARAVSDQQQSENTQRQLEERIRQLEAIIAELQARMRNFKQGPSGEVTLCFTDVQSSTELWETREMGMRQALALHNKLLRELIEANQGYEVKTEGDAFMVAFPSAACALAWCCQTQVRLLEQPWPREMLSHPACEQTSVGGQLLFCGLRVRMGFNTGFPDCEEDPVSGRTDYFGPMVNRTARVGGKPKGGQIYCGSEAYARLAATNAFQFNDCIAVSTGKHKLKGIADEEEIWEIKPNTLVGRSPYFEEPVVKTTRIVAEEESRWVKVLQVRKNPNHEQKMEKELQLAREELERLRPLAAAREFMLTRFTQTDGDSSPVKRLPKLLPVPVPEPEPWLKQEFGITPRIDRGSPTFSGVDGAFAYCMSCGVPHKWASNPYVRNPRPSSRQNDSQEQMCRPCKQVTVRTALPTSPKPFPQNHWWVCDSCGCGEPSTRPLGFSVREQCPRCMRVSGLVVRDRAPHPNRAALEMVVCCLGCKNEEPALETETYGKTMTLYCRSCVNSTQWVVAYPTPPSRQSSLTRSSSRLSK